MKSLQSLVIIVLGVIVTYQAVQIAYARESEIKLATVRRALVSTQEDLDNTKRDLKAYTDQLWVVKGESELLSQILADYQARAAAN